MLAIIPVWLLQANFVESDFIFILILNRWIVVCLICPDLFEHINTPHLHVRQVSEATRQLIAAKLLKNSSCSA